MIRRRVAVVYETPAGAGGLGLQAATAIAGLSRAGFEVHAVGPDHAGGWPLSEIAGDVVWVPGAPRIPEFALRRTPLRWYPGLQVQWNVWQIGRWAARELERIRPDYAYLFTHVAYEGLNWCRTHGVPTVLDNPNGGIQNFREVYDREVRRWCGGVYRGHPTQSVIERVEEEYRLADRIRVSSAWARASTAAELGSDEKIVVVDQPIDLVRFRPPSSRRLPSDELHVVFVGSIDARKGVMPLLRAVRTATRRVPVRVTLVGGTVNRGMFNALRRESMGLNVTLAPGDPVPAYHAADLLVLPSLEDGFGFVVPEAMACGLPVLTTDACGASEWVADADAGWVVPAGDEAALADVLLGASAGRAELSEMGDRGRQYVEKRAGDRPFEAVAALWPS